MMSGKQLLPLLVGCAVGAGGWLLKVNEGGGSGNAELLERLRMAEEDMMMLVRENESLKSLAQGGGTVAVPQEMIDEMEKDHGLKFVSNPVVNRVAGEELGYKIQAAIESRLGPHGIEDRQEAYQRLGWLVSEDDLLQQMIAVRSVGAVAWFDEETGEGWVTDRFDLKNVPDQAAMIRLLVRILLNQHSQPDVTYPGDDAAWAREALHAGAASAAEARYYAATARSVGFMPSGGDGAAQRVMMGLPAFLQGVTMFPVISGRALADTRYVAGIEEFTAMIRNPPQTTYQVAFPSEEARGGVLEIPGIEGEVFLKDSAGYLGVRLWLEELGDVGLAEEIARGWMKDGYVLFADGESSSALAWDVELESKELADDLEMAMRGAIGGMKEMSPGRFFEVVRVSDVKVRYVNGATEMAVGKLKTK